jgi:RNA-directed DNA polymerase
MNTADAPMYEWKALPWKTIQRRVFKLQKRIYRASQRGDLKTVHRLQRLLTKSWSAKCLAVRRVTQDNRGKRTAGIDGVSSLTPPERLDLVATLRRMPKARPVRRVWIPKPGSDEQRPLGIPTMRDRAAQALAKLALEPEWEARFEPNSFGFRPGRSCHDAIEAIFGGVSRKAKYVFDADIAQCFDRIDHSALLDRLRTFPALRRVIRGWLRAGVMDGLDLSSTPQGTPQGGVISPLLANIALHGLEEAVRAAFPECCRGRRNWKPIVVRYADDFVVLHEDLAVIERVREVVVEWAHGMGLALKPSKTRVVHTLHDHDGNRPGFDFLGFHVRQYPVGKTHTARATNGRPLGFKAFIRPSDESLRRHTRKIDEVIRSHQATRQVALITRLTTVVTGWTNYFSTVASKRTFAKMDWVTFQKLYRWAKRRHPRKSRRWIVRKYWRLETGRWDFAAKDGPRLPRHSHRPIQRHVKVEGHRSPFDGDWVYWASRLGSHPELPRRVARLLAWQRGRCPACGLYFSVDDPPEVDHILPLQMGGQDRYTNWQLLHRHCHDLKTSHDRSARPGPPSASRIPHAARTARTRDVGGHRGGTHDKSRAVEEPDEPKGSRPVL